jgi:hypothetical protein
MSQWYLVFVFPGIATKSTIIQFVRLNGPENERIEAVDLNFKLNYYFRQSKIKDPRPQEVVP